MNIKGFFVSLLACCLLLSSCSSPGTGSSAGGTEASAADSKQASEDGKPSAASGDSPLKDGTVDGLTVVFPGQNSSPGSLGEVEAAMNAIVGQEVDAEVKLQILEWGVYEDQTNLMLSSGENVSAMFIINNIANNAKSGKIQPITELVEVYGKDAAAAFDRYLDVCKVDGELYGLPTFRDYSSYAGLIARADLLEKMEIDPESVKTWADVEAVLAQAKESYPEMNLLTLPEHDGALPYYTHGIFDEILENTGVQIYVNERDNIEVVNYFATPEYRALAEKAYEWNQKGYFIPDATTATNTRQEYISAGNTFGYIGRIHPGTVTQETKNSGYGMRTMPVTDAVLRTSGVNFGEYTLPTGCKAPEKTMAFLNILYSNPDMQNLMAYGIEGKDYLLKDEANDVAGYPEGVDESNVGWLNETWVCGNGAISHVWEIDPVTIWDDYRDLNENAIVSPIYGFVYNIDKVKNEITAVDNVISKYRAIIDSGYAEVDASLEKFNSELEAAGIQKIIDDAQAQIDAWLAE